MSVLVTMRVAPVAWDKFQAAIDALAHEGAAGRKSSAVYRLQSDPRTVLVVEEWDSHDAMHAYQERVGDEFNRRAGTEGMEWEVAMWERAGSM